jgi:hypothetical protein
VAPPDPYQASPGAPGTSSPGPVPVRASASCSSRTSTASSTASSCTPRSSPERCAPVAPSSALRRTWRRWRPSGVRTLASHARGTPVAAHHGLPAPTIEGGTAACAYPARRRRPSGMVRLTPDAWPSRTRHRGESDATAPAAILAHQRLPPGLDIGGTHAVGHDDGPSLLGQVPPAHVTEFRRNGGKPGNSAARASGCAVRGRLHPRHVGSPGQAPGSATRASRARDTREW